MQPPALDDDRAVHDALHHRPDLAAGNRHHHLVEPADALGHLTHRDERLAVAETPSARRSASPNRVPALAARTARSAANDGSVPSAPRSLGIST